MVKSLEELSSAIANLDVRIKKEASAYSKRLATELIKAEVLYTPVWTSKAISNWQVSIGVFNGTEINAHFPGWMGNTERLSSEIATRYAAYRLKTKQPGQDIFLFNAASYIMKINEMRTTVIKGPTFHFIQKGLSAVFFTESMTKRKFKLSLWE